ncbi:tape measure protein [Lacticaseibacillus paracasei]|uniref:tape measure protein n=1 Tax=Lacticaseibacillus paracasei TaxID=1597 RepID=UPI00124B98CB|nr:tape measure protein [Lacticaseibacillus paracasei]KAB1967094.1 tape measure protein [Lacticaseibacillus paracasei]MCT3333488.1 phage tail tape measure protein [Lacticaseibacillus paracasei]
MAADGTISIEVALKGKDQLISDTEQADKILNDFGSQAGDKMDNAITENTNKAKRTLASFPKEVKTELIAEAKDAGIKNFSTILKKLPKEQRVELLTKVEDGKAIDFEKLIKSLPKEVKSEIKVKDEATVPLEKIEKKQQDIPGKKETTVKANDHASAPLRHISNEADDTGRHFRGLRDIIAGTMIGNLLSSGFIMAQSTITGLIGDLNEASASWQTFDANMQNLNMPDKQIAATRKELQEYAQQTIYSASDMATTYSQLAAVGTKNTDILVKGFGGLAAASADPAQAMKSLSQQATQMAAKPKVQWQDFQIMLEQSPAGMAAVSRKMGMSTSELIAKIQDGKVTTGEFFDAIEKAGNAPGFQKMATQYKTVGQAVDGLKETITNRLIGAFQSVSQSGIKTVSLLTDSISGINFDNLAKGITKPIDYINAHFDTVTDIAKNIFKIGQIIGGTIFKTAYDVVINIAKALGLVDDESNKVKDPLNKIDGILKNIVSHKDDIEKLTKVWLAFFAIKKITGWIKSVNEARKAIMELGIATKIFGDGSGSGISLPSLGKRGATGTAVEDAESVAVNSSKRGGLFRRIFSGGTAKVGEDALEDLSGASSLTSKFSKAAGAAKGIAGIGTAISILSSLGELAGSTKKTIGGNAGSAAGGALGTWAGGAATGAAVGTFAGPVGTAIGAGLGAAAGGVAGSSVGKKIGKEVQEGVESTFHPKLSNGMTKATEKLHGGMKSFVKSYQGDMDKIMGDTIMLGSATGKQAGKIEADMTKAYAHMSKSVDDYYKGKESKSKKDLDLLVKNGSITQKQADEALAKEKKNDASKAAQMKKSYADMQKESEKYFKDRNDTESKYEKKSTDAVNKILKDRAAQREKLVKAGATKEELAGFDATTARKVAAAKKKLKDQEDKDLQKLQNGHLKTMKTLQSQADANTYQSLKVSAGKEKDLLQKLSEDKHKMGQKELKEVISTSAKQTNAVVTAAKKTYNEAKDAANKKYKATTSAAETEYYVNHSISKSQYEKIVGDAKNQRDDTISAAKKQRDGTVSHARKQHDAVVSEATKQAGEHKSAVNTETGDVKSTWDRFLDGVAGVWNHLIDAWNWVGKLWGKKPSGHWKRYAAGTGGTREDQLAVVGEEGFELAHHPSLGVFPLGVHGMETTFLPAGTSILPHNQSEEFLKMTNALPHHATGIFGTISDLFDGAKKIASGVGSEIAHAFGSAMNFIDKGVSGAWSWIEDKTGIKKLASNDGQKWSSMRSDFGGGTLKGIKDGFSNVFTSLFKKAKEDETSGGNYNPELIWKAAKEMGLSPSGSFIRMLQATIQSESGGRNIVQQIHDINSGGNEARGILQYTPGTFMHYAMPGHRNIMNPYDQLLAFFNNSDWQNSIGNTVIWGHAKTDWLHSGPQGNRRLAYGGRFDKATPAVVGEDGTEYVVNVTKDNADQLLMAAIAERAKTSSSSIFAKALKGFKSSQIQAINSVPDVQNAINSFSTGTAQPKVINVQTDVSLNGRSMAREMAQPLQIEIDRKNRIKFRREGRIFNP